MPKTRDQKKQVVDDLVRKIQDSKSVVFTSQQGVTVSESERLRSDLRTAGGEIVAVKKTLLKRALGESHIELDLSAEQGMLGVIFSTADEVSGPKIVHTFAKDNEKMVVMGGMFEHTLIDAAKVAALATIPGRDELLGMLVRTVQGPVSGFANVLAGTLRSLVTVVGAIRDSKS